MSRQVARVGVILSLVAAPVMVACGGDDDASASDEPGVLQIEMADFHFGELPDSVPAGTRIEVSNVAPDELHEVVAFRLADDEERSVDEIMAGDLAAALGDGPPALVALAPPGGDQIVAVGDGTLTEPGRYLLLCFIPTGVDPGAYLEAAATSDGPPDLPGGPPHFVHGMVAELVVT